MANLRQTKLFTNTPEPWRQQPGRESSRSCRTPGSGQWAVRS